MPSRSQICCAFCAIWLVSACSEAPPDAASESLAAGEQQRSAGGAPAAAGNPAPAAVSGGEPGARTEPAQPAMETAGSAAEMGATTGTGGAVAVGEVRTQVPCEVSSIISEHCAGCHSATPKFNAPMPLVDVDDFAAVAPVSGQPITAATLRRINAEGAARMPPPGTVDALDATEIATLTKWLESGASAVKEGCDIEEPALDGSTTEVTPRPTKTGSVIAPYEGWDEGVECFPFLAYQAGSADKSAPYRVGTAVDQYVGFGFKPPWQGARYVRAFRNVTDNAQVLHHWILFQEATARDGQVSSESGAHPGGEMLHGWAPGQSDIYFTPDVGVKMDGSQNYLLETHYNSQDSSATDASGVEICVTQERPKNEAIIHWLGTDSIRGASASGTCTPQASEPIHIIGAQPHMHLKGKAMKVVLTRADGSTEVLHDEPFSFENQRSYALDAMVNPGDSIKTTCEYTGPATFGRGTNQEMCYWFAIAYPAGALADGRLRGRLTHGPNACLGL